MEVPLSRGGTSIGRGQSGNKNGDRDGRPRLARGVPSPASRRRSPPHRRREGALRRVATGRLGDSVAVDSSRRGGGSLSPGGRNVLAMSSASGSRSPRPLLDEAAQIAARCGSIELLIAGMVTAGSPADDSSGIRQPTYRRCPPPRCRQRLWRLHRRCELNARSGRRIEERVHRGGAEALWRSGHVQPHCWLATRTTSLSPDHLAFRHMAGRGGDGTRWQQLIAIVVGVVLLLWGGKLASDDKDWVVVLVVVGAGFVLMLLGLFLPWIERVKAGPFEANMREDQEREAVASSAASPTGLIDKIESSDPGPPLSATEDPEVVGTLNYTAGSIALGAVLDWVRAKSSVLGATVEFRLFIYDPELDRMLPAYEPPDDRSEGWHPGHGATGTAWARRSYVYVEGDAVSDATHGLTPDQQARYKDLVAVAATPVFNSSGWIIGVLTASSMSENHGLDTDEGRQDLTLAALLVSRLLVDLFKWFDDADDAVGRPTISR